MTEPAREQAFTEDEVEVERAAIRKAGALAAKKLLARAQANLPVRRDDLVLVTQFVIADAMDFCIQHARKRYVPREETGATERALAPVWAGAWVEGKSYAKDDLVVARHALWAAERDTRARPGEPGSGWKLVCKSPR